MSRRLAVALSLLAILPVVAQAQLVINEIDYDQPGTDGAEFIELYNAGGGAADLCNACEGDDDCREGLACLSCSFECTGETKRCVGFDDLAGCEDGIY